MSEKQKENGKVHLKGQLRLYMQWPAVMALLLVAMNIWIYRIDRRAGSLMFVFVLIYIMMVGVLYLYSKSIIMKDLVELPPSMGSCRIRSSRSWPYPMPFCWMTGRPSG